MRTRIGLSVLMLLTAACSQDAFVTPAGDAGSDSNDPVHGGGSDSGSDGGAVEASVPPGCDATKLPTDDVCVIAEAIGVFASSSLGSTGGDGTQSHPYASLQAALVAAKKSGKRVYACAETYPEQIQVQDGVSVFGYFACNATAWTVSTSHAKVASPASPAATATNVTSPTRVEAVDLISPDFTTGSQSSIALIASGSPGLDIVNAKIHAGTGGKGADGSDGIKLAESASTKNGKNARPADVCNGTIGHCLSAIPESLPGGTNTCSNESGHDPSPGGDGGWDGAYQSTYNTTKWAWAVSGQNVTNGFPTQGTTQTTQGGTFYGAPLNGLGGGNGADGASGGSFGTLDVNGYVPADGTMGTAGAPGQSGGGAAGYAMVTSIADPAAVINQNKYARGEAGASGGAGGCPGLPATAGKGGGASIGIVAVQSPLMLDKVIVEASVGGAGGGARNSSTNSSGGLGGTAVTYTVNAGNGGAGGFAGVSGNGGGGPSIGIAYHGTAPQQLATTVSHASGGSGVTSATDSGNGKSIPASLDGKAADTYAF